MRIKNNKNKTNYINYKLNGIPSKKMIAAGEVINVPGLVDISQVVNLGDFRRGCLEIVEDKSEKVSIENPEEISVEKVEELEENFEEPKAKKTRNKTSKKTNKKNSLDKIEKEVKDYTDNKDNKEEESK